MGTRFWPCLVLVLLLAAAGCGQIPASPLAQGSGTSPGPAYLPPPGAEEGYPAPPPPTSGPIVPQTDIPRTEEPTPAPPPVPTPWPTPAMTPIPVASPPYIPGLGGPEAPFQVFFVKDNAVWVLDSGDGQARLLLDVKATFSMVLQQRWQPVSVSPDGQRLAVALTEPEQLAKDVPPRTAIYLYDGATGKTDLLVEGATDPRWAPDGQRIAYEKEASLCITDLTTGNTWEVFTATTEAARNAATPFMALDWSPDGQWLGFLYYSGGWDQPPEVLIIRADESGETVHLPAPPTLAASGPAWAPNGSRVRYVTLSLDSNGCAGPARCSSLWIANTDGSGRSQLLPPTFVVGMPQWSPDGQWIVFDGLSLFERPDPLYSLWLIKADGTALLRLTDPYPTGNDLDPVWTPDGTRIMFRREGQGIWTFDLIDGRLRQLYPDPVDILVVK